MTAARRLALVAATALLVPAGCGGGGDTTVAHIRLVVADKNIRREGVACAGARPFHHVHAGAPYRVEAGDGTLVSEGTLPAGRAENAEPDIDWGVGRIPTFCVVEFEVQLPERRLYRLRLDRGRPLEFGLTSRTDDQPIVLVVG